MATAMTHGVGLSWTQLRPSEKRDTFGDGTYRDGPATNVFGQGNYAHDIQQERALTLTGQGDRMIDEPVNPKPLQVANANNEFNFSDMKTAQPDDHGIHLTTVMGVSGGDVFAHVNTAEQSYNQTSAALAAIYGSGNRRSKDDSSWKKPCGNTSRHSI